MAIYHNTAKVMNRTGGRSPIATSAYIHGVKMTDEHDGKIHDYSKKRGVVYSETILCANAPKEWRNREKLWNDVIKVEGNNGQRARTIEVALPVELNKNEQIELTGSYIKDNFVNSGMCADFAIHDKGDGNPHAHILLTMRPVDEKGKWQYKTEKVYICKNKNGVERGFTAGELKKASDEWEKQLPYFKHGKGKPLYLTKHEAETDRKYKNYVRVKGKRNPKKTKEPRRNPIVERWNSKESFEFWREDWAIKVNNELEKKGLSQRIDHRSYEKQGIDKIPTKHIGVSAKQIEAKGIKSDRGNINRKIQATNEQIPTLKKEQAIIIENMLGMIKDIGKASALYIKHLPYKQEYDKAFNKKKYQRNNQLELGSFSHAQSLLKKSGIKGDSIDSILSSIRAYGEKAIALQKEFADIKPYHRKSLDERIESAKKISESQLQPPHGNNIKSNQLDKNMSIDERIALAKSKSNQQNKKNRRKPGKGLDR